MAAQAGKRSNVCYQTDILTVCAVLEDDMSLAPLTESFIFLYPTRKVPVLASSSSTLAFRRSRISFSRSPPMILPDV